MEKDDDLNFLDKSDIEEFKDSNFNYKTYINYNNEIIGLVGRIIEEFQQLEYNFKDLLKCALEKGKYKGDIDFSLELASARKIINSLTESHLIESIIFDKLNKLIDFRNYLIHQHYLNGKTYIGDGFFDVSKRLEIEEKFPIFLFMIFEANDYIVNVTNRLMDKESNIPNIFESRVKKYS
jgi:hypothetical protein